jgi:hypothetical protein
MTIFLFTIFIYFWINAFLTGVVSSEEVKQKGDGKAKVKTMALTMVFGLPMYIIYLIKSKK